MNMLRAINSNKIIKCDYSTFPQDQSVTYMRKFNLCVRFHNFKESFGITEMRLFLDDELKLHLWEDSTHVKYGIDEVLDFGVHNARLEVIDGREGEFHIKWRFYVLKRQENLNIYYGNPHSHTSYSDGKMTPTDAFKHAMENKLHFMIVSDHVGKLLKSDVSCDGEISFYGDFCPKWEMTKMESQKFTENNPGFVALAGYELSTRFWGHVNIIECEDMVKSKKFLTEDMISWIYNHEDVLVAVNHPFKTVGMLPCCSPFNKCVMLYEYGNGSPPRTYKRAEERYFEALDEGWFLGAINGQDNHLKNWGDGNNLTGVMCDKLSRENILEAMRMRRVFSTESRSLKLSLRIDGYWMGSIINVQNREPLRVDIFAEDMKQEIEKVQLISKEGMVVHDYLLNGANIFKCTVDIKAEEEKRWFLIKVILKDGRVGISSPVFLSFWDNEDKRKL